jgi:hypothetical protein
MVLKPARKFLPSIFPLEGGSGTQRPDSQDYEEWLRGLDSNQDSRLQRPMCYQLHHPGPEKGKFSRHPAQLSEGCCANGRNFFAALTANLLGFLNALSRRGVRAV